MSQQESNLVPAKQVSYAAVLTPSTATAITVAPGQILEINCVDETAQINFFGTATATVFDRYVLAGGTRHFPVPTGTTSASVLSAGTVVAIVY